MQLGKHSANRSDTRLCDVYDTLIYGDTKNAARQVRADSVAAG